jgi:hypothetical protein
MNGPRAFAGPTAGPRSRAAPWWSGPAEAPAVLGLVVFRLVGHRPDIYRLAGWSLAATCSTFRANER